MSAMLDLKALSNDLLCVMSLVKQKNRRDVRSVPTYNICVYVDICMPKYTDT